MAVIGVCASTGYVVQRVVGENCPATRLVEALDSIFLDHGYCLGILSDDDQRYHAACTVAYSHSVGLRWHHSPNHTSYLSGWHESRHRLVNYLLRSLIQDSARGRGQEADWFELLPRVCYICNNITRPSLTSGYFSSDLHYVYGRALPASISTMRELSSPAKEALLSNVPVRIPTTRELDTMFMEFTKRMSDDCVYVAMEAENIDSMMRARNTYADQAIARGPFSLKEGDHVVRYNHGRNKLDRRWVEDVIYTVVSVTGVIACISKDVGQFRFDYVGNLKKIDIDDVDGGIE
ncbi:hypothetical protein FOL47_002328 [Perkinsus chesapeaki]|uniref:Uncharacterized protein n=1 Tax=Perkinsus chesapeaki TaxID=330153 RepID=A0A7J6KQ97_PERCH|nr:hypothetical protein FOL47_002328 [Perkinsus chesapeaki]